MNTSYNKYKGSTKYLDQDMYNSKNMQQASFKDIFQLIYRPMGYFVISKQQQRTSRLRRQQIFQ